MNIQSNLQRAALLEAERVLLIVQQTHNEIIDHGLSVPQQQSLLHDLPLIWEALKQIKGALRDA